MRKALLVVEDEQLMREQVRQVFEDLEWQVYCAPDRKSAEGAVARYGRKICAVISDVKLSTDPHNKDGVAVAKKIKQLLPELPIVGLSAYDKPADAEGAFDDYFRKSGADGADLPWIKSVETLGQAYLDHVRRLEVETVVSLKGRYGISEDDLRNLLSLKSLGSLAEIGRKLESTAPISPSLAPTLGDADFVEVGPSGYKESPLDLSEFSLRGSIPCFLSRDDHLFVAELAFVPSYFGYGATAPEAIASLVSTLRTTFDILREGDLLQDQATDLVELRHFVEQLFEPVVVSR